MHFNHVFCFSVWEASIIGMLHEGQLPVHVLRSFFRQYTGADARFCIV